MRRHRESSLLAIARQLTRAFSILATLWKIARRQTVMAL
jgi:hypothetical protein